MRCSIVGKRKPLYEEVGKLGIWAVLWAVRRTKSGGSAWDDIRSGEAKYLGKHRVGVQKVQVPP